jgi:hypothetical protein
MLNFCEYGSRRIQLLRIIKLKQDAIEYITKKLKKPASEDRALCSRTISI